MLRLLGNHENLMLDSNPPLAEDLEAKEWRNTPSVICLQIC